MTGSEVLIGAAISGVAVPIFQSLWQGGGQSLRFLGRNLNEKTRETIFRASNQYAQNYEERHGILKVLGMRESVLLESVYTTVQFLDDQELKEMDSIEGLEEAYRTSNRRSFRHREQKKRSGLHVANDKPYLMVLGGPGAGKSTFLRRMGLEALKGNKGKYQHRCIPVLIELKEFRTGDINVEQMIAEEFRICGFPDYEKFTAKALEQGKLLILLDGLDEVPTRQMNKAIQQIQNFVDLYDKNRFITSCRVAAYRHNFRRFTDVTMAEFDDDQIQNFITNWFRNDPIISENCWQKLNSRDYAAAKELAHTPLLLTLVCLLYQRSQQFPSNRATLYEKALRVLLEEWAGEKSIPQELLYQRLDTRLKESLLSEIAYQTFESNRLFFPRREIADQIKTFLEDGLPEEAAIDGEAVLQSIEVQHGVLVERAEGIYSFSHLTIQEYLTAQYIDDHRQIDQLVAQHITDERWQEVFLLVAGIMRGGARDLLLQMEQQIQLYVQSFPKLHDLFHWAEQTTTGSEGNYKPATKRATAIYLALKLARATDRNSADWRGRGRNSVLNLASNIASDRNLDRDFVRNLILARDLARDLDSSLIRNLARGQVFTNVDFKTLANDLESLKLQTPDKNQPSEVRQTFGRHMQNLWLNALHLQLDWITLSADDFEAMAKYLELNRFMVQCRQAAVRISRPSWAEIEDRMLVLRLET